MEVVQKYAELQEQRVMNWADFTLDDTAHSLWSTHEEDQATEPPRNLAKKKQNEGKEVKESVECMLQKYLISQLAITLINVRGIIFSYEPRKGLLYYLMGGGIFFQGSILLLFAFFQGLFQFSPCWSKCKAA